MKPSVTIFHSHAMQATDESSGMNVFAFSIPGDKLLLCASGEVSVELTAQEQEATKTKEAWVMLLIVRGMLDPAASLVAAWLAAQQQERLNIISQEQPLSIENKQKENNETKQD